MMYDFKMDYELFLIIHSLTVMGYVFKGQICLLYQIDWFVQIKRALLLVKRSKLFYFIDVLVSPAAICQKLTFSFSYASCLSAENDLMNFLQI